jgi:hypothetical protein
VLFTNIFVKKINIIIGMPNIKINKNTKVRLFKSAKHKPKNTHD